MQQKPIEEGQREIVRKREYFCNTCRGEYTILGHPDFDNPSDTQVCGWCGTKSKFLREVYMNVIYINGKWNKEVKINA